MSGLQPELEYKALRSTIRERGTMRMWVLLLGFAAWGALALGLAAADIAGGVTLVPFLILAAAFEISFFIHTGIERIGRYVQVFYEEATGAAGWESTTMTYGRSFPGGGDPLFIMLFAISAATNFLSAFAVTTRRPGWLVISFVAHIAFGWRLVTARKLAAGQRHVDLERFRSLKNSK